MTCMYIIGHLFTRILLPIVAIAGISGLFMRWIMAPETQKSATSIGSRRDA